MGLTTNQFLPYICAADMIQAAIREKHGLNTIIFYLFGHLKGGKYQYENPLFAIYALYFENVLFNKKFTTLIKIMALVT